MKIRLLTALCALWILGCEKPAEVAPVTVTTDTVKVVAPAEGKTVEVNNDGVKVEGETNFEVNKDGVKVDTANGVKVDVKDGDGVKVTIPSGM